MDTFHCVLQGLSRTQHACSCCHSTCQRVGVVAVAVAPWGQRAIQMVTAHMAPTWIPMCCVCLWPRDSSTRHSPALTAVPPPPSLSLLLYLCFPPIAQFFLPWRRRHMSSLRRHCERKQATPPCCFLSNFIFTFSLLLNNICFYAPV